MHPALLCSVPAPLAVALDTTVASGRIRSSTVTSNTVSASVAGGTPPYTYVWNVSGGPGITAVSPNTPATAFRKTGAVQGTIYTGTAQLQVTDSLAAVALSPVVNITLERPDDLGTGGTA